MFNNSQSSSGGGPQPSACYDAKKACLRLLEGGSMIEGSIIEMGDGMVSNSTFLMGEVMEIVIMGDDMVPLAVHNEKVKKQVKSPTSIAAAPAVLTPPENKGSAAAKNNVNDNSQPKKYVYDGLRRSELQSLMKDKSIGREEKLRRMAEIKKKYEDIQANGSSSRESELNSTKITAALDPQTQQPSSSTRAANRWNRGAVAAVSANALKESFTQQKVDPQSILKHTTPNENGNNDEERSSPSSIKAAGRWNKAAVAAVSGKAMRQSITIGKKSQQQKNVNGEDIDEVIRRLRFGDRALKTLVLDGRAFDDASWEGLFDAIEYNKHLTELSCTNCNLEDSTISALVLALVENETLISIDLSYNEELTDETGLGLRKVLKQGNAFMKKINIEGTSISSETAQKIQDILDERDESLQFAKLQEARQAKIRALLAFSASERVQSERGSDNDDDDEEEDEAAYTLVSKRSSRSVYSTGSQKSGDSSKGSGRGTNGKRRTTGGSTRSIASSNRSAPINRRRSMDNSSHSSAPNNKLHSAARKTMAARQMANLGGDMNDIGKSASQLKELRQQRGECVHCGQKCFQKTMFKTTPLTIPNKVHEGRCLRCVQFN